MAKSGGVRTPKVIPHGLTRKEQIFVLVFLETGSSCKAALAAGYTDNPHREGKALLELPQIDKAIKKLFKEQSK